MSDGSLVRSIWTKYVPALVALVVGGLLPHFAFAATLEMKASTNSVSIGQNFSVNVMVNSPDVEINAAQATVKYNQDTVKITDIDKSNSSFDFWLAEPAFDNTAGNATFVAGASKGFSGTGLHILTVNFTAIGSGPINISFDNAAVSASDGSGSNVLTATYGVQLQSVIGGMKDIIAAANTPPPAPVIITRKAVPTGKLPVAPQVTVPLYPDPAKWNRVIGAFIAQWPLPADVTNVATAIDHAPLTKPHVSAYLFDNKSYAPLDDGVWYLHVTFKNDVGWGPTTHYRIGIDTTAPILSIITKEDTRSDSPTRTFTYTASDELSGFDSYITQVDSGPMLPTDKTQFTTDALEPGEHLVTISARDKAGNASKQLIPFFVIPIPAPTISTVTSSLIVGDPLPARGSAQPGATVIVTLKDERFKSVTSQQTIANNDGAWSVSLDSPLRVGFYYVEVVQRDTRGAISLPVDSEELSINERPFFTIGSYSVTYKLAMLGLLTFAGLMLLICLLLIIGARNRRRGIVKQVKSQIMDGLSKIRQNLETMKVNKPKSRSRKTASNKDAEVFMTMMDQDLDQYAAMINEELDQLR